MDNISNLDLRVNNNVLYNDKVIRIKNIFVKSINLEIDKASYKIASFILIEDIKPIVITSQILKRLGFKVWLTDTRYIIQNNKEFYISRVNEKYYFTFFDNGKHIKLFEVKYVHHLQNLIYDWLKINIYLRS